MRMTANDEVNRDATLLLLLLHPTQLTCIVISAVAFSADLNPLFTADVSRYLYEHEVSLVNKTYSGGFRGAFYNQVKILHNSA